jgi:hypothetical protein
MPHNFFWKRACFEARDHGEPSRAVKSAERRNGINGGDPRSGEEAVYAGFALLLTERRAVVSSRGASARLWGRGDTRGKIGRRYGNLGFLLIHRAIEWS